MIGPRRPSFCCRGTSLVEVMVAAAIIGFALLGIASLQVRALQSQTNAEHRTRASDIAWALADRVRANLDAHAEYLSAALDQCPNDPPEPYCAMKPDGTPRGSQTGLGSCTKAEMAAFDLWETRCAPGTGVKQVLPNGKLEVSCPKDVDDTDTDACSPGSEMLITISWATRQEVLDTESETEYITMRVLVGETVR